MSQDLHIRKTVWLVATMALVFLVASCSSTQFSGQSGAKQPAPAAVGAKGEASSGDAQAESKVKDPPAVWLQTAVKSPTGVHEIPVAAQFIRDVTGFEKSDVIVKNGQVLSVSGEGALYVLIVVPEKDGEVTVQIAAGAAIDADKQESLASDPLAIVYDSIRTTVVLSSAVADPTNVARWKIDVEFTRPVTGLVIGDFVLAGGVASNLTGSGKSYSFDMTPAADGLVTIDLPAGAAIDDINNETLVAAQFKRNFDATKPTVVLASTAAEPTNNSPIPVSAEFSEVVAGFEVGDIQVTNGVAGNLLGAGKSFTFDVTPAAQGAVTIVIKAGAASDAAGNLSIVSAPLVRTLDSQRPTLVLASAVASPTNDSPILVTATFSKDVTGFVAGDVVVANATVSGFAGSGRNYSFNVTPSAQGTVTVNVAANVAEDAAGNKNFAAAPLTRVFDSIRPGVTLATAAPQPTNIAPIPFTVAFTEAVADFAAADVTVVNGTVGGFAGAGQNYTFNVTPAGQGVVSVSIAADKAHDGAGNGNTASAVVSRTFDNVRPSVTLASAVVSPTNDNPIPVTITFSEVVTGFVVADLTLVNATASGFAGSGANYTVNIVPAAAGVVSVSVAEGKAQDGAGNLNTASAILSRVFDNVRPTVAFASASPNPTNISPIPVTITFSEAVTGFAVSDLVVAGATLSGFAGSGAAYSVNLVVASEGAVTLNLPANSAVDVAGNGNVAAPAFARTFAWTPFSKKEPIQSSMSGNHIWSVSSGGTVFRILLDAALGYPTTTWTGADGGGHRTFVSEIGLLIGRTATSGAGVRLYRAADDVPTAGQAQLIWESPAALTADTARGCTTAFRVDGVSYVGIGYTSASMHRMLTRIPIDLTKPERIDVSRAQTFDGGATTTVWGYSCFTDQARGIFWGKHWSTAGGVAGINVRTGAAVPYTDAPNGAHKMLIPGLVNFDLSLGTGSYALSGDNVGNVLSFSGGYTMAFDQLSGYTFLTKHSTKSIIVADNRCFTTLADCTGKYHVFDLTALVPNYLGPLSAIGDGRIVAMERTGGGVYLLSLKNRANPAEGVNVEKVKNITGDPYMYTDFTGATSYAATVSKVLDLRTASGFVAGRPLHSPWLKWTTESGTAEAWRGLKLEVRCYAFGAAAPAFAEVNPVAVAGTAIPLAAPMCIDRVYDQVEIKVSPAGGGSDFSRTKEIFFGAEL